MKFDITTVLNLFPYFLFILYFLLDKYYLPFRLGKKQYIHKLQFDKEFNTYKELWDHLDDLQSLVIRAQTDHTPEWKKGIAQLYEKVSSTIRKNKPFYSEEVYKNANKILLHSNVINIMTHHPQSERVSNIKEVEKRIDEVNKLIDNIEKAIRDKIVLKR